MLHRVSTQYIIFYFVLFLFGFVSRAHYICRTEGDGRKGQRDERKARMREKQNCKVTRVKIMEFPPPQKKWNSQDGNTFFAPVTKWGLLFFLTLCPFLSPQPQTWVPLWYGWQTIIQDYFQNLRIYFRVIVFWRKKNNYNLSLDQNSLIS